MIRIYGIKESLNPLKAKLSDAINQSMVEALKFPENKRAHRFFPMDKEDYYYPESRSDSYIVIEIHMMEGRSEEARKLLIHTLFSKIEKYAGISPVDVEIMITEMPGCNFGFRGMTGDEAVLDYKVKV